jgi:lysophospholipase L1-like esterase
MLHRTYSLAGQLIVVVALLTAGVWPQQTAQLSPAEESKRELAAWRQAMLPQWANDFADLGRYREANAHLAELATGENRVVFMGDSITEAWRLEEYFPGKPYVNRGISGQTTPQMLIRFRPDVIDLQAKVVVILAGTNDIAGNTGPMRLEDVENNYASMAELARAHGIRLVFSSVIPVNNYTPRAELLFVQRPPEKIVELNLWLKSYCEKTGCGYLDYFGAMADEKGLLKKDLAIDGLHPNPAGYKIMTPLAQAAIERALAAK